MSIPFCATGSHLLHMSGTSSSIVVTYPQTRCTMLVVRYPYCICMVSTQVATSRLSCPSASDLRGPFCPQQPQGRIRRGRCCFSYRCKRPTTAKVSFVETHTSFCAVLCCAVLCSACKRYVLHYCQLVVWHNGIALPVKLVQEAAASQQQRRLVQLHRCKSFLSLYLLCGIFADIRHILG